ncbi:hypothetical protein FACS18949_02760 [Clostridia bacterium]|nr:hypothetical protein FACS189425_10200 [Clostridia bacterium]GHV32298.1 hypothetical protein FACS18949_02760 [Clostridia bacterium]
MAKKTKTAADNAVNEENKVATPAAIPTAAPAPEPTVTPKPAAPAKAEPTTEPRRFVYVGPSLPNSALTNNKILRGTKSEIKEHFEDALATYPQAERLIVPVTKLAEIRGKITAPDNAYGKAVADISAKIHANKTLTSGGEIKEV